jgi:segregation and condensation protein B
MRKSARPKATYAEVTAADLKPHVEAALFATGKPLSLDELAELLNEGKRKVQNALDLLVADYAGRAGSALEVDQTEAGWILGVKPAYAKVTESLVPMELSQGALRTLSLVAAKEPILQTELVALRGSSAYDHLKELLERGLIAKLQQGRSYVLSTTPRFREYFKLDKELVDRHLAGLKPGELGNE